MHTCQINSKKDIQIHIITDNYITSQYLDFDQMLGRNLEPKKYDFDHLTSLTVPYSLVVSGSDYYVYLVTNEKEVSVLALAGIKQDTAWTDARNEWIRNHDIIQFANTYYGLTYAENSRETSCKKALCMLVIQ